VAGVTLEESVSSSWSSRPFAKGWIGVTTAVLLVFGLAGPQTSYARPLAQHVDTSDRQAVEDAFAHQMLPALETPIGWTGNVESCDAGHPSAAAQDATLAAINFVRSLGQLDPVTFDPTYSAKAQEAALMMQANGDLDHAPPSSWRCWTQDGAEAAGSSNLSLGNSGAGAVWAYMTDDGSNNTAVGHRRWIMRPLTATMGSGSTSGANSLWVFGDDNANASVPAWIAWPGTGYFPSLLEPDGRWSLSTSDPNFSLSNAEVTVTDTAGTALPVSLYSLEDGYGPDTLVWEVSGVKVPSTAETIDYVVRVANLRRTDTGATFSHEYEVRLFSLLLTNATVPSIQGIARVRETLTAILGDWSPDPDGYEYEWLRDGQAIPGAYGSTYRLARRDRGKRISVQVTASRFGYMDGTAVSPPTRRVGRRR
jgi:uncharacterized protein YkwD